MTAAIREHHQNYHPEEWRKSVIENQLKGWEELAFKPSAGVSLGPSAHSEPSEPFTADGLGRRIARWIVRDDQVSWLLVAFGRELQLTLCPMLQAISVVESDLFREIIRYASTSPVVLQDRDILHRTLAHALIVDEYDLAIKSLRKELEVCYLFNSNYT